MLATICNLIDSKTLVRVKQFSAAGERYTILQPGEFIALESGMFFVEETPMTETVKPRSEPAKLTAPQPVPVTRQAAPSAPIIEAPPAEAPLEPVAAPPAPVASEPAPVMVGNFVAGSDSGGPGYPVDPFAGRKVAPEPPNNGKTTDWDPNAGFPGLPPRKHRLHSDFG